MHVEAVPSWPSIFKLHGILCVSILVMVEGAIASAHRRADLQCVQQCVQVCVL